MNKYSKLSIQLLKDEARFDLDFCDKKKLEIIKPELPNSQTQFSWIKMKEIDDLKKFKNSNHFK